jgi:hypothetical protein
MKILSFFDLVVLKIFPMDVLVKLWSFISACMVQWLEWSWRSG